MFSALQIDRFSVSDHLCYFHKPPISSYSWLTGSLSDFISTWVTGKTPHQASAITLDSHIITPLPSLAPEIVSHEMGHVFQYRILGPIFLPAYAIAQLIAIGETRYLHQTNVHARNYFEIWANSISHLPLEPTY